MLNEEKLLKFYSALYNLDERASEIKQDIRDQLKSYAENEDISVKAISSGFNLYKRYKNGKSSQSEIDDYSSIENTIMSYFANNTPEDLN